MFATVTNDLPSTTQDASNSLSHFHCGQEGDRTRFLVVTKRFLPMAITTALVAFGVTSNYSGDSVGIRSVVTPNPSGTDVAEVGAITVLPEHFSEAYAEMRGYSQLMDGWDGLGSVAPPDAGIRSALSFLSSLPETIDSPEPGVTADGHLEWYWRTALGVATVSFNGARISYYARSKDQKIRASAYFDGASIPSDLVTMLLAL
jgi:hypothetical protein